MLRIEAIARELNDDGLAVAVYDYETGLSWSRHGDRWFHAASTIKVAVLFALFVAVDARRLALDAGLRVHNQFYSIVDGAPFSVSAARDGDRTVHEAVGRTMRVEDLARRMIVRSSNLATNLLVDLVGVEAAQQTIARHGIDGIELARRVEDERAFEASVSNRVTANGLVALFRAIYERRGLSADSSQRMMEILFAQELRSGIPAGLPAGVRAQARIANKTGEISVAAHDAGMVFLPNRQPYVVAVLTELDPSAGNERMERVARVSSILYESLMDTKGEWA